MFYDLHKHMSLLPVFLSWQDEGEQQQDEGEQQAGRGPRARRCFRPRGFFPLALDRKAKLAAKSEQNRVY